MPHHLHQAVVTLECLHCGTRTRETVERLCVCVELVCEACQTNVSFDHTELHRAVAYVATAARALEGRVMDSRDGVTRVLTTH